MNWSRQTGPVSTGSVNPGCCSLCIASISMPRMPRFRLPYSRSPDLRCSIYICISRALFLDALNSTQIGLEPYRTAYLLYPAMERGGRRSKRKSERTPSFPLPFLSRPQRNRFFTLTLQTLIYRVAYAELCLVLFKISKLYKILHHIKSLNACIKY